MAVLQPGSTYSKQWTGRKDTARKTARDLLLGMQAGAKKLDTDHANPHVVRETIGRIRILLGVEELPVPIASTMETVSPTNGNGQTHKTESTNGESKTSPPIPPYTPTGPAAKESPVVAKEAPAREPATPPTSKAADTVIQKTAEQPPVANPSPTSIRVTEKEPAVAVERKPRTNERHSFRRELEELGNNAPAPLLLTPEQAQRARSFGLEVCGDENMEQAWQRLEIYGPTQMVTLIRGETGTGKEPFAKAVNKLRAMRQPGDKKAPFVVLNCAAVAGSLIESEMFGHVKGAFTNAISDRKGKFEEADGGTLFLDEIGDMLPDQQAKLLRVLEDGIITPVGSNAEKQVKVKIVCATNRPLEDLVAEGKYRHDLYQRLRQSQILLPSWDKRTVAHRVGVIRYLQHVLGKLYEDKPPFTLTEKAMTLLLSNQFPGNVRQIRSLLERAYVECTARQGAKEVITIDEDVLKAQLNEEVIAAPRLGMRKYGPDVEFSPLVDAGEGKHKMTFTVTVPTEDNITDIGVSVSEILAHQVLTRVTNFHVGNTAKFIGLSRRSTTDKIGNYKAVMSGENPEVVRGRRLASTEPGDDADGGGTEETPES